LGVGPFGEEGVGAEEAVVPGSVAEVAALELQQLLFGVGVAHRMN